MCVVRTRLVDRENDLEVFCQQILRLHADEVLDQAPTVALKKNKTRAGAH